ncbi:MAG: hypothetical protein ACI8SE_001604 [Bacteroidia bacterium]|jgi:hypothetical protein
MIEKDHHELNETLESVPVLSYKLFQIEIRAAADTINEDSSGLSKDDLEEFRSLMRSSDSLESSLDFAKWLKQYQRLKKFVSEKNEDDYLPLVVACNSSKVLPDTNISFSSIPDMLAQESNEHAVLSIITLTTPKLNKSFSLYEANAVIDSNILDSELRVISKMFKGIIFQQNGLYYLGEKELNENIDFIEQDSSLTFPLIGYLFPKLKDIDSIQYTAIHGLNYLFRAVDRLQMEHDSDKARAVPDLEVFLNDANKLGYDNEGTWAIETYVYLEQNKDVKAVATLHKLKNSNSINSKHKDGIKELINRVNKGEPAVSKIKKQETVLLNRLMANYVSHLVRNIEWDSILRVQKVPMSDEMMSSYTQFTSYMERISTEYGAEKWDKAKNNTSVNIAEAKEWISTLFN